MWLAKLYNIVHVIDCRDGKKCIDINDLSYILYICHTKCIPIDVFLCVCLHHTIYCELLIIDEAHLVKHLVKHPICVDTAATSLTGWGGSLDRQDSQ